MIADFKVAEHAYFIASTVDLLSTGVDVPEVRNIVFFRYRQFAHRFLSDGRARYAPRAGKADVPGLRLHRRLAPVRRRLPRQGAQRHGARACRLRRRRRRARRGPLAGRWRDGANCGAGRYVLDSEGGRDRPVPIEEYRAVSPSASPPRRRRYKTSATAGSIPRRAANSLRLYPRARPARLSSALCNAWATMISMTCWAPRLTALTPRAAVGGPRLSATRRATGSIRCRPPLGVLRAGRSIWRRGDRGLGESDNFQLPAVIAAGGVAALRAAGDPRGMVTDAKRRVLRRKIPWRPRSAKRRKYTPARPSHRCSPSLRNMASPSAAKRKGAADVENELHRRWKAGMDDLDRIVDPSVDAREYVLQPGTFFSIERTVSNL